MKPTVLISREALPEPCSREYDFWQVQCILKGDEENWETLYRGAYGIVFSYVMRVDVQKLFRHEEYCDIVDEAFALCYAQLDRYPYWVGGYAKNITRNRCAKESRKQKQQGTLERAASQRIRMSDPMLVLLQRERNAILWNAFYQLDRLDQNILSMRILEENSFAAIARELRLARKEVICRYGVSVASLHQRLIRDYA